MPLRSLSLTWKLTAAGLVLVAGTVCVGARHTIVDQRRLLDDALQRRGESLARAAAATSVEALVGLDYPMLETLVEDLAQEDQDVLSVAVRRPNGDVVARAVGGSRGAKSANRHVAPISFGGTNQPDAQTFGRIELILSRERLEASLVRQQRSVVLYAGLFFVVCGSLLVLLVRRLLGVPLRALDDQTRRLSEGDFEEPVEVRADGELARLAATLEQLRVNVRSARTALEEQNAELVRVAAEKDRVLKELELALVSTQAAERAKAEFLANMSHELRTPLNGVQGMSELLLAESLPGDPGEWAQAVNRSARELARRLGGVFDWLALEDGTLSPLAESFDLRAALGELTDGLRERARDKGLALHVELADDLPSRVVGDCRRLVQVLEELGDNALKFTDRGWVRLEVRRGEDPELRFDVVDSGPGLDATRRGELFQAFHQADGSTTRRHGGTGLGLALSRRLAELMGGDLEPVEGSGVGAHLRLSLPLPAAGAGSAPRSPETVAPALDGPEPALPKAPARPAELRVLVVDDNPVNRRLATVIVRRGGHTPLEAGDGCEALERYREQAVDLVLMDCQMPRMDGFEATRRIRELEHEEGRRRVPIVAVTAGAFEGGERRCREAGMDAYLAKPVDPKQLLETIAAYGRPRESAA